MGDKAQTYVCSNAGDAFSHVLNDLRDKALSYPSPTLGWYEYSAPQHAKPTDRSAWAASNPSLGITITESGLEEALSVMPMEKFLPEHMCMWVSSLSSPWPIGSWEACADSNLSLPIGPDTFMAFDVAISKRTATLVAGQYLPNGKIGVGIMDQWRSDTAVDELQIAADIKTKWVDKYFPRMIMFDHYSTASIAARLAASGCRMVDVSGTAFYQASGDLLDAIVNNRIVHMGQESFDLQMNACAAKTNDSGWRIVRRASAGDVSAPISLAMIVHKMQEPVSTPMIVAG
jgi:phage terminase large subunit-like protein